jgi:hypothetical protein
MKKDNINDLINEALAIESKEAKEAGTIGYTARAMIQATLPHSKIPGHVFKRTNGLFKLVMLADPEIGLPYGSIPRLLLAWIATEATRTKSPQLILGKTLTSFMQELTLSPTGGRFGTITSLKDQLQRLFSCSISCTYDNGKNWAIKNIQTVQEADLWWDTNNEILSSVVSTQGITTTDIIKRDKNSNSTIVLNQNFFNEIVNNPVPIDMRVLKLLKRSPLALDIYCWLTYRLSYLKRSTTIPWKVLLNQFGCGYPDDPRGRRDFKRAFLRELKKVSLIYPQANIEPLEKGLFLNPSNTHIPRLPSKG